MFWIFPTLSVISDQTKKKKNTKQDYSPWSSLIHLNVTPSAVPHLPILDFQKAKSWFTQREDQYSYADVKIKNKNNKQNKRNYSATAMQKFLLKQPSREKCFHICLMKLRLPHQILTFYFLQEGDKKEVELHQSLKTPCCQMKSFLTNIYHLNTMPLFLAAPPSSVLQSTDHPAIPPLLTVNSQSYCQ